MLDLCLQMQCVLGKLEILKSGFDLAFTKGVSGSHFSGREEIILGADSSIYITAEIANVGEEAHQARLVIRHPENVVYEAVGTLQVRLVGMFCFK